jgi:dihydropteroate synthase
MHIQGTPQTMQKEPRYDDVVAEVLEFLHAGVESAVVAGVERRQVLIDPGIGFGKTVGHNLLLLRRLEELRVLGRPVLVGASRKSLLGHLLGGKPPHERVLASAAASAVMAASFGADVIRVHDVEETREALSVAEAIRAARDGGGLFAKPSSAP